MIRVFPGVQQSESVLHSEVIIPKETAECWE